MLDIKLISKRPRMRKCVDRATRITRTPVEDRPDIEDWVHDEGPLLLIGEAAHPCPVRVYIVRQVEP